MISNSLAFTLAPPPCASNVLRPSPPPPATASGAHRLAHSAAYAFALAPSHTHTHRRDDLPAVLRATTRRRQLHRAEVPQHPEQQCVRAVDRRGRPPLRCLQRATTTSIPTAGPPPPHEAHLWLPPPLILCQTLSLTPSVSLLPLFPCAGPSRAAFQT